MYMPIHPAGFIITLLAIIFMVPVCLAAVRNGHSVSDDLYEIFVYAPVLPSGGNGLLKKHLINNKKFIWKQLKQQFYQFGVRENFF